VVLGDSHGRCTCSAGLLTGCRVDLPVHAALYTNGKNALAPARSLIRAEFARRFALAPRAF